MILEVIEKNVREYPNKLILADDTTPQGISAAHFWTLSGKVYAYLDKKGIGREILLLDENGIPVPEGEPGEVCFENRFMRGYINLPDETAEAFRGGVFHTGDLGKKDENGNLIICGRLCDMVKINGNRVEPAEIEKVAQRVMGLKSKEEGSIAVDEIVNEIKDAGGVE